MTVHDLAADWEWMEHPGVLGFTLGQGKLVWETAAYSEGSLIRVERLDLHRGRRIRYVQPDTPATLVVC